MGGRVSQPSFACYEHFIFHVLFWQMLQKGVGEGGRAATSQLKKIRAMYNSKNRSKEKRKGHDKKMKEHKAQRENEAIVKRFCSVKWSNWICLLLFRFIFNLKFEIKAFWKQRNKSRIYYELDICPSGRERGVCGRRFRILYK